MQKKAFFEHNGYEPCPECGQTPSAAHPRCCEYCGLSCNLQYGCVECRPDPESDEWDEWMACPRCGEVMYVNGAGGASCNHC